MSANPNIPSNTVGTRLNLRNLRAGDRVFVFDGVQERNVWADVADVKEVDGRIKIRAAGTGFYFDQALVISFNICRDDEPDERDLAPADHPFTVEVINSPSGSIGVIMPINNCEGCGIPTRSLYNIGTPLSPRFVCSGCRSPRSEGKAS